MRRIVAALCGAALLWIVLDHESLSARRRAQLVRAWQRSAPLHEGDTNDYSALAGRLELLAKEVGVEARFHFNASPELPGFHVYAVQDQAFREAARCSAGNAVYDPVSDAVFLDEALIAPAPVADLIALESMPPWIADMHEEAYRTVLDFIFLHELAHRELHRGAVEIIDANKQSPVLEQEADVHALRALQRIYATRANTNDLQRSAPAPVEEFLGLRAEWLDGEGEVILAQIAASFMYLCFIGLRTQNELSPYYEDDEHPTLPYRGIHLIRAALAELKLSPVVTSYLSWLEDDFVRYEAASERVLDVFLSPVQVQHVAYTEEALLVANDVGECVVTRLPFSSGETRRIPAHSSLEPDHVWGDPDGLFIGICFDGTVIAAREQWTVHDRIPTAGVRGMLAHVPPQPTDVVLVELHREDDAEFLVLERGHAARRFRTADLIPHLPGTDPTQASLSVVGVTQDHALVSLGEGPDFPPKTKAVVRVNLHDLTVERARPISFTVDTPRSLLCIEQDRTPTFVFIDREALLDGSGDRWKIVDPRGKVLAQPVLPSHRLPEVTPQQLEEPFVAPFVYSPVVTHLCQDTDGKVLFAIEGESVFQFDSRSNSLALVLHPDEFRGIVLEDGKAACFSPGAYKVFLVRW